MIGGSGVIDAWLYSVLGISGKCVTGCSIGISDSSAICGSDVIDVSCVIG